MAGEFGHVCMDENGPPCGCGKRGCWEVYASNTAALKYYAEAAAGRRAARRGASPLAFDGLLELADEGDRAARGALDRMARHLGAGLALITTGLSPGLIVVVGEVARAWGRVGPIVQQVVEDRVQAHLPTKIVPTADLSQPRLRGGIAAVLHNHLGAPKVA
jgi:predicted NBD/HSP70 family sugar kinase